MYIIFPCILLFLVICALLMFWRRKCIIRKICCMSVQEKLCRLNELVNPFGFEYLLSQDIFTSRKDAWQRDFGYCHLYDKSADLFNMVFDCEPIYFDYEGCTWMIELWKGQYGINVGADLPFFSYTLYQETCPLYRIAQRHWWLTGFQMGRYTDPDFLLMKVDITFPSCEMQNAFVQGLLECGYPSENIHVWNQQVSFRFSHPHTRQPRRSRRVRAAFAQWKNRIFLKIYCHVTKHFFFTMDKLLYLYEYLPFAFRHMLRIRHKKKRRRRRKHVR